MPKQVIDTETLKAALDGYGSLLLDIKQRIADIQNKIRPRYQMTDAGRKKVSAAQKKRWRQYREDRDA